MHLWAYTRFRTFKRKVHMDYKNYYVKVFYFLFHLEHWHNSTLSGLTGTSAGQSKSYWEKGDSKILYGPCLPRYDQKSYFSIIQMSNNSWVPRIQLLIMYHFKQPSYVRHTHKYYLLNILFVLQNHLVVLEFTTHFTKKKFSEKWKCLLIVFCWEWDSNA